MPERPETRIYSDQLSSLLNTPFSSDCDSPVRHESTIKWYRPVLKAVRTLGKHQILEENLDEIVGGRCKLIRHRGKVTCLEWDNEATMFVAYGMTGSWSLEASKYSRVDFVFTDDRHLYFQDVRKFGRIGIRNCETRLAKIGCSMFMRNYDARLRELRRTYGRRTIRKFLLDSWICPGVGNYICNEALWRAKTHPLQIVDSMSEKRLAAIITFCRKVYLSSLNAGGLTFSDYCRIDGTIGSYQREIQCYRRKICSRCGSEIDRLKDGASSMYWCRNCAPLRR